MLLKNPTDRDIRFTAKEREFVFGVAMRYMKDEEDASDVAQDALLLAYRHRASFQGNSRYTTWLYRIAATTALMHLRKRRRTPQMVSTDSPVDADAPPRDEPRDLSASPEDATASLEALGIAASALRDLDDKYGRIFTMRFVEGLSEAEIARRLDLNVSTVKTRAYRARAYLRRHLTSAFGDGSLGAGSETGARLEIEAA